MEDAIKTLENAVNNISNKVDTLHWKIKKFEKVVLASSDQAQSIKIMDIINKLAVSLSTYDEIISSIEHQRNKQLEHTNLLQIQANSVKSKLETLRAIMAKGKSIEL